MMCDAAGPGEVSSGQCFQRWPILLRAGLQRCRSGHCSIPGLGRHHAASLPECVPPLPSLIFRASSSEPSTHTLGSLQDGACLQLVACSSIAHASQATDHWAISRSADTGRHRSCGHHHMGTHHRSGHPTSGHMWTAYNVLYLQVLSRWTLWSRPRSSAWTGLLSGCRYYALCSRVLQENLLCHCHAAAAVDASGHEMQPRETTAEASVCAKAVLDRPSTKATSLPPEVRIEYGKQRIGAMKA